MSLGPASIVSCSLAWRLTRLTVPVRVSFGGKGVVRWQGVHGGRSFEAEQSLHLTVATIWGEEDQISQSTSAVGEHHAESALTEPIARLRITLEGFEPAVWRQVRVPLTATLKALHDVIQAQFGWEGYTSTSSTSARNAMGCPIPSGTAFGAQFARKRRCGWPNWSNGE